MEALISGAGIVIAGAGIWGFILGRFVPSIRARPLHQRLLLTFLLAVLLTVNTFVQGKGPDQLVGAIMGTCILVAICLPTYMRSKKANN